MGVFQMSRFLRRSGSILIADNGLSPFIHLTHRSSIRLNTSDAIAYTNVEDLSLEQIFKDWIRGTQAKC